MELFVMNRFDPTKDQKAEVKKKENAILAKLNARKRKATEESQVNDQQNDQTVPAQNQEITEKSTVVKTEPASELQKNEDAMEVTDNMALDGKQEDVKEAAESQADKENENQDNHEGFTILDEVSKAKGQKAFRVLPNWLAKPSVISCDLSNNKLPIKEINGIDKFLVEALKRNKIHHFFPVQQQVIPWLLESQQSIYRPCDMCVSAPTGSGKTLAYALPTVQSLIKQQIRRLRCLVVLPVHDLAVQVHRVYSTYCTGTKLRVALISGQVSFFEEQNLLVRKGKSGEFLSNADIVVCTPGRLVDHLQRTLGFSLKSLRYLIIDEADRIMDESHNDWLYHVEKAIEATPEPLIAQKLSKPWERHVQKLLFSATLSQDPEKLTRLGLFQPKLFTSVVSSDDVKNAENTHHFVGKYTTPAELTENFIECSPILKPLIVNHLMRKFSYKRVLCFTGSKENTHRLCLVLKNLGDLKVVEFSSDIPKAQRDQLLKDFSTGKIDLMVCTDAMARGMDVGIIDCVISYDPPKFATNYIHRIGRTARAGRPGTAITILTPGEVQSFEHLIQIAEKKSVTPLTIENGELEVYEDKFKAALELLKTSVDEEKQGQLEKSSRVRRQKKHPSAPTGKRFKPDTKSKPGMRGKKRVGLKLNKRKMALKQPRK